MITGNILHLATAVKDDCYFVPTALFASNFPMWISVEGASMVTAKVSSKWTLAWIIIS